MYGREPTKQEYPIPRTTKEIYGKYLSFEEPLPWYKRERPVVALICVSLTLLAFGLYKGVL